ncbi:hypothetical protein [Jannaschia ovalis]|uniref:Uncharacterized protein n=1 Tax=Jannaschia ovalis TaxID=3038773 RepID=A0ABY8L9F4_9RHOB|nr:hypothetical protein [Jannaschia sp. GRR-S6-38]WGH77914.1 hypothetical protein P8627_12845 [Jannaschia sp. GRR-S6-38]
MPLTRAALRLRDLLRGRPLGMGGVARLESASLMVGLGGMATALGVTMAQATLPPIIDTEAALRRAVIAAEFDEAVCPDGWAADHALLLDLTEPQIFAWYLRESFALTDREVISGVGLYLANARDFRMIAGPAFTRNQILLCIAESRRLTMPEEELVPPALRNT